MALRTFYFQKVNFYLVCVQEVTAGKLASAKIEQKQTKQLAVFRHSHVLYSLVLLTCYQFRIIHIVRLL